MKTLRIGFTHLAIVFAVILGMGALGAALPGCASLTGGGSHVGAQLAVQYATGKYIESGSPVKRAADVLAVAKLVKAAAASDSATVGTLRSLALEKVSAAHLAPADQLLAVSLVTAVADELQARISMGILDANARLAVDRVLDWVIAAASVYGG